MQREASNARVDHVLRTLANDRRRRALAYLREHGDATEAELADVLTGWLTTDRESGRADPDDRHRIEIELEHVHLPMLTAADLVVRDDDTGVVRVGDLSEWVERALDAAMGAAETGDPSEASEETPGTSEPDESPETRE